MNLYITYNLEGEKWFYVAKSIEDLKVFIREESCKAEFELLDIVDEGEEHE
jgi:hypothetical protein